MSTNDGIQGSGATSLADSLQRIGSMHVVVAEDGEHRIESHDGWPLARNVQPELAQLFAAAQEFLTLSLEMREWLKPELVKEPERSFFWKLVSVIRKAGGNS